MERLDTGGGGLFGRGIFGLESTGAMGNTGTKPLSGGILFWGRGHACSCLANHAAFALAPTRRRIAAINLSNAEACAWVGSL